jgi:hypothetical protein
MSTLRPPGKNMPISEPPGPPENPYGRPDPPTQSSYPPPLGQPQRPGPPDQPGGYRPPPGPSQWGQPQQSGPHSAGPFAPGAAAGPPKSGGNSRLIIAGVLAVLVLVGGGGVAVWALTHSSSDSGRQTTGQAPGGNSGAAPAAGDEGDGPEDAVRAFWQASFRGDCGGVFEVSTENFWSDGGTQTKAESLANCKDNGAPQSAQLGAVTPTGPVTGDTATVKAQVTIEGETRTVAHKVVKDDGAWKIDSLDLQ